MIVVVDYGMGNLGSIVNMLRKVGADAIISSDPEVIQDAGKIILAGEGAFDSAVSKLKELQLWELIDRKVTRDHVPILGICLGMQLMTRKSEEGVLPGFGWLDAKTIRINLQDFSNKLRVPHMGWNFVEITSKSMLFHDMYDNPRFYFMHSYHLVCNNNDDIAAYTTHGYQFVSSIIKDNIMGVQFHPEKSHKFGIKLFTNFEERIPC
jgi:glutamine amidotransferase